MPRRPCLELECKELVRSGRCPTHSRVRVAARNAEPQRQIYRSGRWADARADAIGRAGGRCQALDGGQRCPITSGLHGHHNYPGGLRRMLAAHIDPFDTAFIVVLCDRHHGQVTAWERSR